MSGLPRFTVVAGSSTHSLPVFIARTKTIVSSVGAASGQFPNLTPPLSTLEAQLSDLETAQAKVVARVPGSAATRDAKVALLRTSVEGLRMYVQTLCDASPEQAPTLAAAAGMKILERRPPHKPALAATRGPVSGAVKLTANRGILLGKTRRAVLYTWQSSTDGGKTWVSAAPTTVAHTVIAGLTPLTEVAFRVSASTSKETSPWSQAVTIPVG